MRASRTTLRRRSGFFGASARRAALNASAGSLRPAEPERSVRLAGGRRVSALVARGRRMGTAAPVPTGLYSSPLVSNPSSSAFTNERTRTTTVLIPARVNLAALSFSGKVGPSMAESCLVSGRKA